MDAQKFKELAGSMKNALGVQREIRAFEIPKGISLVAKEFSPGKPEKTIKNEIRQKTSDRDDKHLASARDKSEADARRISQLLKEEIKDGSIEVESRDRKVIIRILEQGAFESGYAEVAPSFRPVMLKLKKALTGVHGKIQVTGHTDDIPIANHRFRSNWELSAARAGAFVHTLSEEFNIDKKRFQVIGMADTKPLVPNTTEKNRAKNRRIEITIIQGER